MMSLIITISTKIKNEKISIVEHDFTFVADVTELFNMKMMIDKFANIAKSTIVKFLNILNQLFELKIAR